MERVLLFFTETLSGTTYIIVVIVAIILFFACIGFLAERSILNKRKEEQYVSASEEQTNVSVVDPVVNSDIKEETVLEKEQTVSKEENTQPVVEEVEPVIEPGIEKSIPEINGQKEINNDQAEVL